jgi:RNA polymerase sigma-70 factor (ECF subfamily)
VVSLYDGLHQLTGSPVVLVNRALALAELEGADVALAELDTVAADPRLAGYQPYWVARGELLHRLGRADAAILALEIALGLEREPAVRTFLQRRITAVSA